jgi:hypothetical protein
VTLSLLAREERRVLLGESEYNANNKDQLGPEMGDWRIEGLSQGETPVVIAENGEDALNKSLRQRMIILGGPGTGKTTLLKHLVGERAYRAEANVDAAIPIFLSLPEFARSGKSLKEFLLKIIQDMMVDDRYANVLWTAIEKGRAFICLDSLDEVASERLEMIQKINTFISASDVNTAWVVSSRFTNYRGGELTREQLTEWELQPMNHHMRQELAQRLLSQLKNLMSTTSKVTNDEADVFVKALEVHPRVSAWGKNPLLFSLAALVFVRTGALPNSRAELYHLVIKEILESRERLPEQRVALYRLLGALALELNLERKGRTFSLDDLDLLLRKIRKKQEENWNIEEMTRRVLNSGMLEVIANETYGFLHQTFQEHLAARHVVSLTRAEAEREIHRLIDSVDEPFCRQVLVDLVYIANEQDPSLESFLYERTIARLATAKMGVLAAQRQGRNPSNESPIVAGITYLLEDLIDHWGMRLCSTLENGNPRITEDGEIASTISGVFERNPWQFAVPSLIAGLYKYEKRGRFIGALGKIGTEQAKLALFTFTQEQIENPNDPYVFQYLASALGEAHVEQAIPLLQIIRDGAGYPKGARREAHHALWFLGQEETPGEEQLGLQEVLEALSPVDEKGRPSDYKRAIAVTLWLQQGGFQNQLVQTHYPAILSALETALNHQHDEVREAVVITLGELGNFRSFGILAGPLIERIEPSYNVAKKILAALTRLVERGQVGLDMHENVADTFSKIRLAYPTLEEEVKKMKFRVWEYFEDGTDLNQGEN